MGDGEVATAVAQVGVPIQLAQTAFNLASMNTTSVAMGAVGSVLENGRSWLAGLKSAWNNLRETGDYYAAKQELASVGEDIVTNVGSAAVSGTTEVRTSGSNGGLAVLRLGVRVNAKFMYIATENLEYIGRPLCAFRTLNTLSGFCQVADGDIAIAATAQEAELVKSFLEKGLYLDGYSGGGEIIVETGNNNENGNGGGDGGGNGEIIVGDGGENGGGDDGGGGEIIVGDGG